MKEIPETDAPGVLRTTFCDDVAWMSIDRVAPLAPRAGLIGGVFWIWRC